MVRLELIITSFDFLNQASDPKETYQKNERQKEKNHIDTQTPHKASSDNADEKPGESQRIKDYFEC